MSTSSDLGGRSGLLLPAFPFQFPIVVDVVEGVVVDVQVYADVLDGNVLEKLGLYLLEASRPRLILLLRSHVFPFLPFGIVIFGTGTDALLLLAGLAVFLAVRSQFDAVVGVLVFDDGSHLESVFEGARHVICGLARLHRALDARPHPLPT
jgi:hypothetical protein